MKYQVLEHGRVVGSFSCRQLALEWIDTVFKYGQPRSVVIKQVKQEK